ncbi:hypothetical protein KP509_07G046500 [Ceratopteris richardii]|uniref:Plastid lipid-associated protein/fibrillin conserved domain-containing protein n=1 Tax=Ceratopteris richardii TaxID=49495 RepID=A0A8T2U9L7_CERRI|nr:hypothetical protein KP509_07G046500 [Ceratopteris richardii]
MLHSVRIELCMILHSVLVIFLGKEAMLMIIGHDWVMFMSLNESCGITEALCYLQQRFNCLHNHVIIVFPLKRVLLLSYLLFAFSVEWDVVYSSNPTSTGGYYRSALGRALLNTKQMMQIVKEPDSVSNKVSFAALGIFDGEVSLQGKLEVLDKNWIKIKFESPELKIGSFDFQYGGQSSVKIAIIYLDERVRLGRGSRGSLFVFRRR